jgi:hypothetical protein
MTVPGYTASASLHNTSGRHYISLGNGSFNIFQVGSEHLFLQQDPLSSGIRWWIEATFCRKQEKGSKCICECYRQDYSCWDRCDQLPEREHRGCYDKCVNKVKPCIIGCPTASLEEIPGEGGGGGGDGGFTIGSGGSSVPGWEPPSGQEESPEDEGDEDEDGKPDEPELLPV